MSKTLLVSNLCLCLAVAISPLRVGYAAGDEAAYTKDHDKLITLFDSHRIEEGIRLLKEMKLRYPDHLFANTYNLALFHALLGEYDDAMTVWEKGLDAGVWYMIDTELEVFSPLRGNKRFERIVARCHARREEAKRHAVARFEVELPRAYDEARRYPLFVVLHDGNSSAQHMRRWWYSDRLSQDFVVAYLQSSQVAHGDGLFGWKDLKRGRSDVARLFHELLETYPIAVDQVYVGGFSQGARLALDLAMTNVIPVSGVVAFSPSGSIPRLCPRQARLAARKGLRVVIFAGKQGKERAEHELMAQILDHAGVANRLIVEKSGPHGVPEGFPTLLEDALVFVSNATQD